MIGIVAFDLTGVIGDKGKIPWHVPGDLEFFRKQTTGHTVIMGRKTFESIGKPLKNRKNIVLTHRPYVYEALETDNLEFSSLEEIQETEEEQYVIGGTEVYNALWDKLGIFWVSLIHGTHPGDTFFPVEKLLKDFLIVHEYPAPDGSFTIYGMMQKEIVPHTIPNYEKNYGHMNYDFKRLLHLKE